MKLLSVTPCFSGHTPVSIEDHAGPLTDGVVVRAWAVYHPLAASASMLGVGTSASTSARTPSMPIRRTLGVWAPAIPGTKAQRNAAVAIVGASTAKRDSTPRLRASRPAWSPSSCVTVGLPYTICHIPVAR